jgi:hypothetical protein
MLIAMAVPVQASVIVEDVLVNDTSIYLVTGKTWNFYQGYNFSIKSVNQEADSVWLELSLGNKVLKSQILGEGDTFIYGKNGRTILNITVNDRSSQKMKAMKARITVLKMISQQEQMELRASACTWHFPS